MAPLRIPLASAADEALAELVRATSSRAIAELDGMTLLGERAMLAGFAIPGRVSAGGGCRLYDTKGGTIALNLARQADRELLPALFESDELNVWDDVAIGRLVASRNADFLLSRGRLLGLAIAAEHERLPGPLHACEELVAETQASHTGHAPPRVLDLSALWAGPLAAHLLWLAGAEVAKVESRRRPDAMRDGDESFYRLLNQGKASVVLDFGEAEDRQALLRLIAASDIVIEAARPRGLAQMGIDADSIVRASPGLVWITITGHGAQGEPANWVGFGDDCGVAAGLTTALREASGRSGFVGDAIADPLTGLRAANTAWKAWSSGRGGRFGLAMTHVAATSLRDERVRQLKQLEQDLRDWSRSAGQPFPNVGRREIGSVPRLGADTRSCLARVA